VVPKSPTAQGSPTEEQQQPEGHDVEDKADEEHSPPSDTEDEKMYRDVDKVESFRVKLRSSPPLPGTGSRKSRVYGGWRLNASQRFSSDPESSADTRDQLSGPPIVMLLLMPPGRPSHHGSIATSVSCRTPSTTSCPTRRRINSRPMGVKKDMSGWRWYTTRM
jgi:hypothetical protein